MKELFLPTLVCFSLGFVIWFSRWYETGQIDIPKPLLLLVIFASILSTITCIWLVSEMSCIPDWYGYSPVKDGEPYKDVVYGVPVLHNHVRYFILFLVCFLAVYLAIIHEIKSSDF